MKVLVLCSGGDGPGMNRFIYELYHAFRDEIYFANAGFLGLTDGQIFPLEMNEEYKNLAGTVIKSSRFPEFKEKEPFKMGLENAKKFDAVVILGGNGSEKGAKELYENGANTIFVPGTIDNDVEDSSYAIGFLTAVKEGVYAVQNSMPSIQSFNNSCIFEVMGRQHPAIAKAVAKEVNADVLIAEKKDFDVEKIKNIILKNLVNDKSTCIIARENIMSAEKMAKALNTALGQEIVKYHIVGRTQRGGKPTKEELLFASKLAKETIFCIKKRVFGVRVLMDEKNEVFVDVFK